MFIRKKRNKSGSVSVQIIDKKRGYKVAQTIGSSRDPDEVERMVQKGRLILYDNNGAQGKLFSVKTQEDHAIENFLRGLENTQVHAIGPELIFGTLFNRIGFDIMPDELFRHITIARLAHPTSKLKTVDYLYRYRGIHISEDAIYRFLDTLNKQYKEQVEKVAYNHTKQLLRGVISVVFYDMTTLYFEAEDEDDLRKIGFSKDGKFQHPQIMLGLLVGKQGLPIGYGIFEGNTFEGHTLLPTLQKIQKKYSFGRPTVIADSALLSKKNLENLGSAEYHFIIGARIKNETDEITAEILKRSKGMKDKDSLTIKKKDGTRLIVTYSDKRAHKDAHNREKGLRKLRKRIKSGRLTKEHINNRGYNKFLTLKGNVAVSVDEDRVETDKQWDGLKGYITNTRLTPKTVVENYSHLWQIEKAFRISKTDLRIRPIYHYRRRRIEAHICIAFVAYTIYKELERLLAKRNIEMSGKRASELTHTMYELEYTLPRSNKTEKIILKMNAEQQLLYNSIHR
jgi:transposase